MKKKIIAIFPGRFQPFGPHHEKTFKWLQSKFGTSNTYIVTSDKVSLPKSPLDFDEKKTMMVKSGAPSSQIYKVKNPYNPVELTKKFNPADTALVIIYGKKDAGRISYTKKDGSKGYFQPYKSNDELEGLETHGYIIVAPNVNITIPGFGSMSGTKLREFIPQATPEDFKKLFGWYDEKFHELLSTKFGESVKENLETDSVNDMHEVSSIKGIQSVDDGPRFMYGDLESYQNSMDNTSKRPLGWEVANWIIGDIEKLEKYATDWPNGPVPTVSFYPTGIPNEKNAGTSYYKDLKGNPAFKAWMNFAKKISTNGEMKIIDDLGADQSIKDSSQKIIEVVQKQNINILSEGGGAGHMSHIIEDDEMTFGDLKKIIKRSLEGDLDIEGAVTEKTDGMNLLVTYKDGKVKAARNKTTILNPMDIEQVSQKFKGRGTVRDAFVFAMADLNVALSKIDDNKLNSIFKNGLAFANLEVIYPENSMTVNYGPSAYLQIHGLIEFDENGKKVKVYPSAGGTIQKLIAKVNGDIQDKFQIIPPVVLKMSAHEDSEAKLKSYTNYIKKYQGEYGLSDSETITEYYIRFWSKYLRDEMQIKDDNIVDGIANRWSGISKQFRLNKKNIPNQDTLEQLIQFEKSKVSSIQQENIDKFEDLILKISVDVMDSAANFLAANPKAEVQKIRTQLARSIRAIRSSGSVDDIAKMKRYINKLKNLGGFDKIVPTEGLVFMYKGKMYKMTGSFMPIHRIMSLVKFRTESIIVEGGNITGVNSLVPKASLESTVDAGLKSISLGKLDYDIVGNKNKDFLGDVDIAIDAEDLMELLPVNLDTFWEDLKLYLESKNIQYKIVKGLSQFHLVVPVLDKRGKQSVAILDRDGNQGDEPGMCQIDIMIGDLKWMRDALSGATESLYKAVYRNILFVEMLSNIIFDTEDPVVKRKLQIDWKKGVQVVDFKMNTKGKREKLKVVKIYGDMNKFVKFIFDKSTSFSDVNNFEKAWKLFNSSKFRFPALRKDIINSYKSTLERMKLPIPSEL